MRIGMATIVAALALAPAPLPAQDSAAQNDSSATTRVGPSGLESFSLNGTVTREADPQPVRTPPQGSEPAAEPAAPATATAEPRPSAAAPPAAQAEQRRPQPAEPSRPSAEEAPRPSDPVEGGENGTAPAPQFSAPPVAVSPLPAPQAATMAPASLPARDRFAALPWILALMAACAALAYWLLRQRSEGRIATAGGPPLAYAAPEPLPAAPAAPPATRAAPPQPPGAPPPAAPQIPAGIVSTRLRPWIEIEFTPTRCVVEEDRAIIQFEAAMFNSGAVPARDVLMEMGIFNAGPAQDEEIARFQAKPEGEGGRAKLVEPLRRIERSSQIAVALDKLRVFEANGRRFFVPLIVVNAYYSWQGGEGRTSSSFLIGRDRNGSDKMSPFRLDLGPRVFRNLGAREHHLRVRV